MKNLYYIVYGKYNKFENPKISYILEKALVLSIIWLSVKMSMKKYLKKKNQLRYYKFLV